MKCEEIKEILNGYVDGEAGGDEGRLVEEHLAACPGCRDLARRLRIVGAGIEKTEGAVPSDFRETLFARMEREGLLPRRRSLFVYSIRWAAVPLAAAAALALFLLTPHESDKTGPVPSAERPTARGDQAPRGPDGAEPSRVARQAPEAPKPAAGKGAGGTAVADSRAGGDLTAEERDIVAYLEVLEDPGALDEPSEIDELQIVDPAGRKKG